MDLILAICRNDWKTFSSLLDNGADVFATSVNGGTVLHALAGLEPTTDEIFSKKKSIRTYFLEIYAACSKRGKSIQDFALIQDAYGNTAMHEALYKGNWPLAYLLAELLGYKVYYQNFRQNQYGLNEYEWALVLNGIGGRYNDINAVFGKSGNIGSYQSTSSTIPALVELKKAINSIKIDKDKLCAPTLTNEELQALSEEEREHSASYIKTFSSYLSFLEN